MISFKAFLTENDHQILDWEDGLRKISQQCQPFLSSAGLHPALRGIRPTKWQGTERIMVDTKSISFSKHPRKRKSVDSGPDFNFMFNNMIQAAFGIPEVRTKSIFLTGSWAQASSYGDVMYCFPAGDIEYLWSGRIHDSYEDGTVITQSIARHLNLRTGYQPTSREIYELFDVLVTKLTNYDWCDDPEGISEKVTDDAFKVSIGHPKDLISEGDTAYGNLYDALKITAKDLYQESKDLPGALKSGNEILVFKSSGYYSVPYSTLMDKIKEHDAIKRDELARSSDWVKDAYEILLRML